jgi:hypothetical protein
MRDSWRANSESGVDGGRINKTPRKISRAIIFFPLLTVFQRISATWHFAWFQEPVRSAGSSFLITPAIIYHCANGQQRPTSRKEGRM